jgi:membrane dipeptidase
MIHCVLADAHLDLAYNAIRGRDITRPALEQTPDKEGIPTVGLPDLRAGNVKLVCATIFCEPNADPPTGFRTPQQAHEAAERQLAWYRAREADGSMRFVRWASELRSDEDGGWKIEDGGRDDPSAGLPPSSILDPLSSLLLMEGADPLRTPKDIARWFDAGLRIVGLAWRKARYAGGTGNPGPLTAEGALLVKELDKFGIIHDASHLAEESFWQLLDVTGGPVIASHSNCRAIVPTDRQLSDDMIRAIVKRGGVIGINFFDRFLLTPEDYATKRRATLKDVIAHVKHICDLAGNDHHVGLGTDMDGGLGREEIPQEIITAGELPKVAEALSGAGFTDNAVRGIMGRNWMAYFPRHLPTQQ